MKKMDKYYQFFKKIYKKICLYIVFSLEKILNNSLKNLKIYLKNNRSFSIKSIFI